MSPFSDSAFLPRHGPNALQQESRHSIGEVPPDQVDWTSPNMAQPAMELTLLKPTPSAASSTAVIKITEPVTHKTTSFHSVKKYDVVSYPHWDPLWHTHNPDVSDGQIPASTTRPRRLARGISL